MNFGGVGRIGRQFLCLYILFQFLVMVSGSNAPLSVVVSGSMEPTLYRGDVIVMYDTKKEPYRVGEIIAFQVKEDNPFILHRIVDINDNGDILTKGDNNPVPDDQFLYHGRLSKEQVKGRVCFSVPWIAKPFTWLIERPILKYTLVALDVLRELYYYA